MSHPNAVFWMSLFISYSCFLVMLSASMNSMYDANWEDAISRPCKFAQNKFYNEHVLDFGQKINYILASQTKYDKDGAQFKGLWPILLASLMVVIYVKIVMFFCTNYNRPVNVSVVYRDSTSVVGDQHYDNYISLFYSINLP